MNVLKCLLFSLSTVILSGCYVNGERIKGNGNMSTDTRTVSYADRIESLGSFNVEIIVGNTPSVRIEGESNLIPYIQTENTDGVLRIKVKKGYNIQTSRPLKIFVTTPKLELVTLAGSGDIKGNGKFTGASQLEVNIAGTGNVSLEVNTPEVKADIAGSGDIILVGETRDLSVEIAGSGNFDGMRMMSENVNISIAGSGDVNVFADKKLDVDIAGMGDINYKGNAVVSKSIAGSGKISKVG